MKREADDQSKAIERKVVDLSRRCFSGRVIKMVGMGIFSHFSLLGSNLWAQGAQSGDDCPGGGDDDDLCMPPTDEDECPGGQPAEDQCYTGEAPDDVCTAAGGCAGGDQEGLPYQVDEFIGKDSCTSPNEDHVE